MKFFLSFNHNALLNDTATAAVAILIRQCVALVQRIAELLRRFRATQQRFHLCAQPAFQHLRQWVTIPHNGAIAEGHDRKKL